MGRPHSRNLNKKMNTSMYSIPRTIVNQFKPVRIQHYPFRNIMNQSDKPLFSSIHKKITQELNPTTLDVIDESHLHRGHAAMRGVSNPETHFRVTVVSEKFEGLPLMKRHRMVYALLSDEFSQGLHALSLTTKTLSEWNKIQQT